MNRHEEIKQATKNSLKVYSDRLIKLRSLLENEGYDVLSTKLKKDFPEDKENFNFSSYKDASLHLEIMEKLNTGMNVNDVINSIKKSK